MRYKKKILKRKNTNIKRANIFTLIPATYSIPELKIIHAANQNSKPENNITVTTKSTL